MSKKQVDQYLAKTPQPQRETLKKLREVILEIYPDAKQVISYKMPAFEVDGHIVGGFLAAKKHCSFFPFSGAILPLFKKELAKYDTNTGTLRFPVDKPLPKTLVKKLLKAKHELNKAKYL
jgi:uncharacterized protein YdhG (YjbR/CyaY superfamily)